MSDETIQDQIERLVNEEHELLAAGGDPDTHERLQSVKVELDRCWDLLRQRRAKEEFGQDPDEAEARDERTVEGYQQ
jgi:hypothetical protein